MTDPSRMEGNNTVHCPQQWYPLSYYEYLVGKQMEKYWGHNRRNIEFLELDELTSNPVLPCVGFMFNVDKNPPSKFVI